MSPTCDDDDFGTSRRSWIKKSKNFLLSPFTPVKLSHTCLSSDQMLFSLASAHPSTSSKLIRHGPTETILSLPPPGGEECLFASTWAAGRHFTYLTLAPIATSRAERTSSLAAAGDLGKAFSYSKMLIYIYTDRIGYDNGHGRRHATGIWVHDISCFHLLCADCHGNLDREMCACGAREAWPVPSPLRPPEPTCRSRSPAVATNYHEGPNTKTRFLVTELQKSEFLSRQCPGQPPYKLVVFLRMEKRK